MQPTLPVQATRPERMAFASVERPSASIAAPRRAFPLGHAGDQKILPHREADIAVAALARDFGKPAHLHDRHAPTGTTTPIQCKPACFCGWTPICAVRENGGRGATRTGRGAVRACGRAFPPRRRQISRRPSSRARI